MPDDPNPEFRCVCIGDGLLIRPEPYAGRCPDRPSQEDQLCDHCRSHCLQQTTSQFVPLLTPCLDLRHVTEEAPF